LTVLNILVIIGAKKKLSPLIGVGGLSFESVLCMCIISKKDKLLQCFWLYFHINNGNGTEWIDYKLPIPTLLKHTRTGYLVGWAVDGHFNTKNGQNFANDIIARFLLTFDEITRIPYKPVDQVFNSDSTHIYEKVYKLQEFSKQLKSLPTKKHIPTRADNFDDYTFWAIKLYAEDMIQKTGYIVYSTLESWALSQFIHKERSTIRAKCRSIWNWYNNRDFVLPKKSRTRKQYMEETMASRTEQAIRMGKEKKEKNRRKVINLITGLYANDYKKKNGKWHYIKIAEATNLSRYTVAKIIKEIEEQKITS